MQLRADAQSAEIGSLQQNVDQVISASEYLESGTAVLRQNLGEQHEDEQKLDDTHATRLMELRDTLATSEVCA